LGIVRRRRQVALSLQFASRDDLAAMAGDGARLVAAASAGNTQRVDALLASGVAADARDWDRLTALIGAAAAGQYAVLAMLLNAGADPRAADKDGVTALMEAAIGGHAAVAKKLLDVASRTCAWNPIVLKRLRDMKRSRLSDFLR